MICYWSECCKLWPSLWFVTGQNTVCYDQVYDLLLVRTLYATTKFIIRFWSEHYATTKFMICYRSKHCMLQQVYDLLLVRTLNVTTKFMICFWSEHYVTTKFMICYWSKHYATTKFIICYWSDRCMLRPSWWFVTGKKTVRCDQVYDLLLVRTLCYV